MLRIPPSGLLLGLGLLLAPVAPASSQSADVSPAAVDAAVARGAAHLLTLYADGQGRDVRPPEPRLELVDRPGLRALTVYALLKSGVESGNPVVEKLLARLAFERFDRTYDTSCMLLALCALDPVQNREWIGELAANLIAWKTPTGEFGYPAGGGDLSNTQFAALGLRAAAAAGVEVPPEVWIGIARAVLRHQIQEGGFVYVTGSRKATGSMTVAGIATLALCVEQLGARGVRDPELETQLRRARADGLRWLAEHFAVDRNPEHGSWTHYYLYGLERMGALAGVERVGDHDWYREGAAFLLASQLGDGSWAGTFEREPTLFALLFLRRATAPAPRTRDPGRSRRPRLESPEPR